ncbi:MAG: RNA-directed DNA polymerase [bacterium]|nr:RNA-directed DNA polymerase [bacterium]
MWTVRNLFPHLVDPEYLDECARLTSRGKRRRPEVADLLFRRETVLEDVRSRLRSGTWSHSPFQVLFIRDPKPRLIAKARIEDRIVHAALVRLMEPVWMRSATHDDFACRPGFGTHRARMRLLQLVRRHRFFLHLDVRSYFPSVDLRLLRALVATRVRDERFLGVLDEVLDRGAPLYSIPRYRAFARLGDDWPPEGCGLPIGASTSQFLAAHVYLLALDHRIKRDWHVPGYVRYVDDLFLFDDSRRRLARIRDELAAWLWAERRLKLKVPGARVRSSHGHLAALGCRISRGGIEPHSRRIRALGATVARECRRERHGGPPVDLEGSIEARMGELLFG